MSNQPIGNHELLWSDLNFAPLLQDQTRVAKLKSAYNLLIIGPRVSGM